MGKYYAVRKGRGGPAIYDTWDECRQHVDGYSGAVYKSFVALDDAREFINEGRGIPSSRTFPVDVVAYTDGSFDRGDDYEVKSGFAAILLKGTPENATWLCCIYGPCKKNPAIRNIGGEIEAAEYAVRYAIEHGYKHIRIFHDYVGVGAWGNGQWRATKPDTIAYANFIKKAREHISISFKHIRGHSGHTYNELADSYAKAGAEADTVRRLP